MSAESMKEKPLRLKKKEKHSQLLDDFVRWNSEVDYGKKAWWKEFNAASDLISNLEKSAMMH